MHLYCDAYILWIGFQIAFFSLRARDNWRRKTVSAFCASED